MNAIPAVNSERLTKVSAIHEEGSLGAHMVLTLIRNAHEGAHWGTHWGAHFNRNVLIEISLIEISLCAARVRTHTRVCEREKFPSGRGQERGKPKHHHHRQTQSTPMTPQTTAEGRLDALSPNRPPQPILGPKAPILRRYSLKHSSNFE
jgi:hypothetical protein